MGETLGNGVKNCLRIIVPKGRSVVRGRPQGDVNSQVLLTCPGYRQSRILKWGQRFQEDEALSVEVRTEHVEAVGAAVWSVTGTCLSGLAGCTCFPRTHVKSPMICPYVVHALER